MFRFSLLFILFSVLSTEISAQDYNMSELGYLNLTGMHGTLASDIWGYVDEDGNEYAIVGLNNGTSIVDVTDPANPEEVFFEPGSNSIWRDMKTYGDYAYVTTEAKEGLLIIDLSPLPSNTNLTTTYFTPTGTFGGDNLSSHNIYIDEFGVCYLFGSNVGAMGVLMFDIATNPTDPEYLGIVNDYRAHDGVAKNNILYVSNLQDGFFIYDVSDKSNPVLLGDIPTPSGLSHNVWFSDDEEWVYHTDEVSGAYIVEYNVKDPTNIQESDRIRTTTSDDVIPHNTHYIAGYIVTSYYRDGVIIHDVTEKGNMVEVGRFDTALAYSGNGFDGCWGVYPWLPSHNIIASDMQNGLYIIGVDEDEIDFDRFVEVTIATEKNDLNNLNVSPNPFSNNLYINGDLQSKSFLIEVYNSIGQQILVQPLTTRQIDVSNLDVGMYFVKVISENGVELEQKVLKQ